MVLLALLMVTISVMGTEVPLCQYYPFNIMSRRDGAAANTACTGPFESMQAITGTNILTALSYILDQACLPGTDETLWVSTNCNLYAQPLQTTGNAPCTSSFPVLCVTGPTSTYGSLTTFTFVETTFTIVSPSATVTVTSTSTVTVPFSTSFQTTTSISPVTLTLRRTITETDTDTSFTSTTTTLPAETSTTTSIASFTTSATLVTATLTTVTVTVDGSTTVTVDTVTSLTEDVTTLTEYSQTTISSCPSATTTVISTTTSTTTSNTRTETTTAQTNTQVITRITTTGPCSTLTVVSGQTVTVHDVFTSTISIIVPPFPPCVLAAATAKAQGHHDSASADCLAQRCGLDRELHVCAASQDGLHLVLNSVPSAKAGCICSLLGKAPADLDETGAEAAYALVAHCTGKHNYAWIGAVDGHAKECLAVQALGGTLGQLGRPDPCSLFLPVLCR